MSFALNPMNDAKTTQQQPPDGPLVCPSILNIQKALDDFPGCLQDDIANRLGSFRYLDLVANIKENILDYIQTHNVRGNAKRKMLDQVQSIKNAVKKFERAAEDIDESVKALAQSIATLARPIVTATSEAGAASAASAAT